jgi:hypothetical protein
VLRFVPADFGVMEFIMSLNCPDCAAAEFQVKQTRCPLLKGWHSYIGSNLFKT